MGKILIFALVSICTAWSVQAVPVDFLNSLRWPKSIFAKKHWPIFSQPSKDEHIDQVLTPNQKLVPGQIVHLVPKYPVWKIHKYSGIQLKPVSSIPYLELPSQKSSPKRKINLPSLDEVQSLLGTDTKEDTIDILKEMVSSEDGQKMVINFVKSSTPDLNASDNDILTAVNTYIVHVSGSGLPPAPKSVTMAGNIHSPHFQSPHNLKEVVNKNHLAVPWKQPDFLPKKQILYPQILSNASVQQIQKHDLVYYVPKTNSVPVIPRYNPIYKIQPAKIQPSPQPLKPLVPPQVHYYNPLLVVPHRHELQKVGVQNYHQIPQNLHDNHRQGVVVDNIYQDKPINKVQESEHSSSFVINSRPIVVVDNQETEHDEKKLSEHNHQQYENIQYYQPKTIAASQYSPNTNLLVEKDRSKYFASSHNNADELQVKNLAQGYEAPVPLYHEEAVSKEEINLVKVINSSENEHNLSFQNYELPKKVEPVKQHISLYTYPGYEPTPINQYEAQSISTYGSHESEIPSAIPFSMLSDGLKVHQFEDGIHTLTNGNEGMETEKFIKSTFETKPDYYVPDHTGPSEFKQSSFIPINEPNRYMFALEQTLVNSNIKKNHEQDIKVTQNVVNEHGRPLNSLKFEHPNFSYTQLSEIPLDSNSQYKETDHFSYGEPLPIFVEDNLPEPSEKKSITIAKKQDLKDKPILDKIPVASVNDQEVSKKSTEPNFEEKNTKRHWVPKSKRKEEHNEVSTVSSKLEKEDKKNTM